VSSGYCWPPNPGSPARRRSHQSVAAWAEGTIWFSTAAGEQKFANLRANPYVVLTTGCNRWDGGLDVVVEGEAVLVTDDAVPCAPVTSVPVLLFPYPPWVSPGRLKS
jgi:hypothetical protein